MADVVIDAASGNPVTVNLAMEMVRAGRPRRHRRHEGPTPARGLHSDWIPTRRITIHPGAGLDTEKAVALHQRRRGPDRRAPG